MTDIDALNAVCVHTNCGKCGHQTRVNEVYYTQQYVDKLHEAIDALITARLAAAGVVDKLDAERLSAMCVNKWMIIWNCESTKCRVFHQDDDGELKPVLGTSDDAWFSSPSDAIDAAMSQDQKASAP